MTSAKVPRAVLLDLDDTIVAFSASALPCWQSICERFAPRIEGLTAKALFEAIQESRDWFWQDAERARWGRLDLQAARYAVVTEAFARLGMAAPDWAHEMADTYAAERDEMVELLPGALESLRFLKAQGVRLGLLTNGPARAQQRKLERFNLTPLFDVIVIEEEFGAGKPDLRVFQHALAQLQVQPAEAWMVGDRLELDIAPAQQLGIRAVWIDPTGTGLPAASPAQPDETVSSLAELVARLGHCRETPPAEPTVLPAVRQRYGRYWSIRVSQERINPPGTPGTHPASAEDRQQFVCGACGRSEIEYVTSGSAGSLAGGSSWHEFFCAECRVFTEYEHTWG